MSNKNNQPAQKQQWQAMKGRRLGFPMALPSGSQAIPFWTWNRNRAALVGLAKTVKGAFGRIKPPRKNAGSFSVRTLRGSVVTGRSFSEPRVTQQMRDSAKKVYGRLQTGALVRLSPVKPWRGKSERRAVLKDRRFDRALAAANLAAA